MTKIKDVEQGVGFRVSPGGAGERNLGNHEASIVIGVELPYIYGIICWFWAFKC